jgi:hypothetical protein
MFIVPSIHSLELVDFGYMEENRSYWSRRLSEMDGHIVYLISSTGSRITLHLYDMY